MFVPKRSLGTSGKKTKLAGVNLVERCLQTCVLTEVAKIAPKSSEERGIFMRRRSRKLMVGISQLLFNHVLCLGIFLLLAPCFFAGNVSAGWFDAATGQPVHTIPLTSDPHNLAGNAPGLTGDPDHANVGDKNLFYDKECGTWRDAKTGEEVRTIPLTSDPHNLAGNAPGLTGDRNHAKVGDKNLFWKPCPPPASAPALAQPGPAAQPPPDTGSSVPSFGFGIGGFGRGQDRSKDSDRRP